MCLNWIVYYMQNLRSVITNAYVETLASDSSNIVDLIQNVYYVSIIDNMIILQYNSIYVYMHLWVWMYLCMYCNACKHVCMYVCVICVCYVIHVYDFIGHISDSET